MVPNSLKPYAKAVVAVCGALVVVAQAVAAPDADIASVVIATLTAAGVWRVPNAR